MRIITIGLTSGRSHGSSIVRIHVQSKLMTNKTMISAPSNYGKTPRISAGTVAADSADDYCNNGAVVVAVYWSPSLMNDKYLRQ